jgi:hypothetical protein
MPPPDPLAPIVQALSFIAVPNPALQTPPQTPDSWTSGGSTATDAALYTTAQTLLGLVLGASNDLTLLGNGINTALTGIAAALASMAGDIGQLAAAGELQSASTLFGQLGTLLNDLPDLAVAAAEMAEISQQLTAAAPLFPAS